MITGCRFRCYPTPAQKNILAQWIGCQRFIYNAKVREDRYFRAFKRKAVALAGIQAPIDQAYSQFKDHGQTPWLYDVPSQILRNGAVRWKAAYSRYFKKLAGRPTIHTKGGTQSVWLTSELFRFEPVDQAGQQYRLILGTGRHPCGEMEFKAHLPYQIPSSISISVTVGRWFISFAYEDERLEIKPEEIIEELRAWTAEDLRAATVGVDRGINIPMFTSQGAREDFLPVQKERMAQQERKRRRYQRQLARRTKGSSGWRKTKRAIARTYTYGNEVRKDFAHQVSHRLVADDSTRLIVFEALRVQSMTRAPKAKQDANGRWLRNGARAKAGLNRKILQSTWGKTRDFTKYKAIRKNKLLIEIAPHHTSQECARCGHIHPDNRLTQAAFICQRCGHKDHADENASKVIADRGVALVQSEDYTPKTSQRVMRMSKKAAGRDGTSRTDPKQDQTPTETNVSRSARKRTTQRSVKSETPATTPNGV